MHTSVEIEKPVQVQDAQASTLQLRLVEPAQERRAVAHFRKALALCEVFVDILTITMAVILGYVIYDLSDFGKHIYYAPRVVLAIAGAFAVVMVLMLDRVGAYHGGNSLLRVRETEQVLRVSAQAFL